MIYLWKVKLFYIMAHERARVVDTIMFVQL